MANPQKIKETLSRVHDLTSLVNELLAGPDALQWPIEEEIEDPQKITFGWSAEELNVQGLEKQLLDGEVRQIRPFRTGQPWGVFLVEFAREQVYRTALRQVLRGLVPSRRRDPSLQAWRHEHLLFICTTRDYDQFTFAHFRGDKSQTARLATFGWQPGDDHLRTLCQFNLPPLEWPQDDGRDADAWLKQWAGAFDVEVVTKRFFAEYHDVFEQVEAGVKGVPKGEPRRLYVQRLFNRLMFLYFIQRKGWLSFQGDKKYLRALFNAASAAKEDFLNERLYWTFFYGLNTAGEDYAVHSAAELKERRGDVPFLNGGLFDLEDDYDIRDAVTIPNKVFAAVLDLFERYNFTVTESTPLDIEVAVDPEMLGKVFEELVTGRHESGSYYTPRPIVAFMCREALKHYLAPQASEESAVARFVDEGDPAKLPDPEAVLNALRAVKVCDPACGSGAYLLGMMQELLRLREALFATRGLDAVTVYRRKLDIIQSNLYGVDIDVFAVNIAKLRLWLSLAIDFEGAKPPPLPNLDFKIECGDSLTAPDPQKIDDLFRSVLIASADRLADLKGQFLETYGAKKKKLAEQIKVEEELLRESLHEQLVQGSVDWRVAFAEVFKNGGFDIALANPPYVRMELFKGAKPTLRRNFPHVHAERADLYVYFYARTHQILRQDGVACFISSNKWLRAGYGESLRQFLLDNQAFHLVVDFGDQPVFDATAYPAIFLWQKSPRGTSATTWAEVTDLEACYGEGILAHVSRIGHSIPPSQFGQGKARLADSASVQQRSKMEQSGQRLGEVVRGSIYRGVVSGLNKAFVIDGVTRDQLIRQDPKSQELIKTLVQGDDCRRYEVHSRDSYLLYTNHGVEIRRYGAVRDYLKQFKEDLEKRATQQEWYELQQPQAAFVPFFEKPKIIYPQIGKEARFALEVDGLFPLKTVYVLAISDWYLLAVLNSASMAAYMDETLTRLRGGYFEFYTEKVEKMPIPNVSECERTVVSQLACHTQTLHTRRRSCVEKFLKQAGILPASSNARNPLEQPWILTPAEFSRRLKKGDLKLFTNARDETAAFTEEIAKVERNIDDRVAALYGL
jgi:hypothetical protein